MRWFIALLVLGGGWLFSPTVDAKVPQKRQRPKLNKRADASTKQIVTDDKGRPLRVAFPLYDRLTIGVQAPVYLRNHPRQYTQPAWTFAWDLSLSLDFSDENIWWQMRHRLLETQAFGSTQDRLSTKQPWRLQTTIAQGAYLRHDLNSFITIPTLNDLRVPANFDIAVDYTLGRIDAAHDGQSITMTRLELLDIAFLLDFIRDEDYRHRFALGFTGWYHADTTESQWKHELAPLSGFMVLYGWDHARGLFSFLTKNSCGLANHFQSDQTERPWFWRCRAQAKMEWTPFTISDAPVSIPLVFGADMPLGNQVRGPQFEATIGIRWGLNTD